MEDKILIELYVPSVKAKYDVFLPMNKTIYEVVELMSKTTSDLSGGLFISDNPVLCEKHSGKILNINMTVEEHNLTDGSSLILI